MFPEVVGYRFDGSEGADSFLNLLKSNNVIKETFNPHSTLLNNGLVPQVLEQFVNLSC